MEKKLLFPDNLIKEEADGMIYYGIFKDHIDNHIYSYVTFAKHSWQGPCCLDCTYHVFSALPTFGVSDSEVFDFVKRLQPSQWNQESECVEPIPIPKGGDVYYVDAGKMIVDKRFARTGYYLFANSGMYIAYYDSTTNRFDFEVFQETQMPLQTAIFIRKATNVEESKFFTELCKIGKDYDPQKDVIVNIPATDKKPSCSYLYAVYSSKIDEKNTDGHLCYVGVRDAPIDVESKTTVFRIWASIGKAGLIEELEHNKEMPAKNAKMKYIPETSPVKTGFRLQLFAFLQQQWYSAHGRGLHTFVPFEGTPVAFEDWKGDVTSLGIFGSLTLPGEESFPGVGIRMIALHPLIKEADIILYDHWFPWEIENGKCPPLIVDAGKNGFKMLKEWLVSDRGKRNGYLSNVECSTLVFCKREMVEGMLCDAS